MRRSVLVLSLLCSLFSASAQNVFNPSDPIIRYKSTDPLGSSTNPSPSKTGLQKWVSTPTNGISTGTGTWDASSFKAYFANLFGKGMAFRLKFPRSYSNPDSAGKKYPVMLFFHGAGEAGCPSNGGIYNNEKQLALGGNTFRQRVDNNLYDGFLVYPQMVPSDGTCWGAWGTSLSAYYKTAFAILDSMVKYNRADLDRVFVDGLSAGGLATWKVAEYFPQKIASIAPSSWAGLNQNYAAFVHIPIWLATGGKDTNPSPAMAQYSVNKVTELGGNIKYTLYADLGHAVWNRHWAEPGFVDYMNAAHKANPLVFFQQDKFCDEASINARLGISPGFYAYEWQRDGVTVAAKTNTTVTVNNTSYISTFTGNEIVVKAFGTYRVRFKRTASSEWSVFSPKPAVIGLKGATSSPAITAQGKNSVVLPSLDGKTSVNLQLPAGYAKYEWYNASTNALLSTDQIYSAGVGQYKAKVFEGYSCGSNFSPVFTVVNANGTPKPAPSSGLSAISTSSSTVKLTWTDGSGETGVEVYRSLTPNGGLEFIRLLPANNTSFVDSNLAVGEVYYYTLRAVNTTGAAAASNQAVVKVQGDKSFPQAPGALQYKGSTQNSVTLAWNKSTDNGKIKRYDIYANGKKLYSSTTNFFTVYGLDKGKNYSFYVIAVDDAGNESAPSNQVIGITHQQGVSYKYYNGTFTALPNFASLTPALTGTTDSIEPAPSFRTQSDKYAIMYEANIYAPDAGNYTFELLSDAGSKLYIDVPYSSSATAVVNNDGVHTAVSKTGTIQLTKGYHKIIVTYFETTGSEALQVFWSNDAGLKRERIYKGFFSTVAYPNPTPPVAPSGFTATTVNNGAIKLAWADNSSNETGFELQRATALAGPYLAIATTQANATIYTDSNLAPSTRYYYKLRAVGLTGESGFTTASGTTATSSVSPAPNAPGNLVGATYGITLVNLSWDDNSTNESGFQVWRSTGNTSSFTKIATLKAGTTAYTDNAVSSMTVYYYYIGASDNNGNLSKSNTIRVVPGNPAPVVTGLKDVAVKTGATLNLPFTVTDNSGDVVTVSLVETPSFVTLLGSGGSYTLRFQPLSDNIGTNTVRVLAVDDKGNERLMQIKANVGDKDYRSVFVNVGNTIDKQSSPWNNWLGTMTAGKTVSGLLDENGVNTGFSITATNAWMAVNNLGFNTGENTGAFPDTVLKSGLSDTSASRQFVFKGLKTTMRYNIVFISSMNQGDQSPMSLVSGSQTATVNAQYNSRLAGNLNGLTPDASGQIIAQIKKGSGASTLYVNGFVIEEYSPSLPVNTPRSLTVEQDGTTGARIAWIDRAYNENSTDGYELQQAMDSLFTVNLVTRKLAANTTTYKVTGLQPNSRFWFRIRAKAGTAFSEFSNRAAIQMPYSLVNVNFNYTVANATSAWNNLAADPSATNTFNLRTFDKLATSMKLTIEQPFNGEFNAGKVTGSNTGVVPDNVLQANYWLDKTQVSTIRISGLNHQRQYNFGFIGSSGPAGWYKGNYTATYTINNRKVYLNSWENTTKIVYINNVRPDENGEVLIAFSTTEEAAYGFNAGMIITDFTNTLVPAASALPSRPNGNEGEETVVDEAKATRVYPNPFRNNLVIDYYHKNASDLVSTEVYDVNGRVVVSKSYLALPKGMNQLKIDNLGNANGNAVYLVVIRVNGQITETHKVLRRTTN